jgi:hypothetical protein
MMNNFTTMQHFNTIYTAHTKIGNRKKKWREREGGENQIAARKNSNCQNSFWEFDLQMKP